MDMKCQTTAQQLQLHPHLQFHQPQQQPQPQHHHHHHHHHHHSNSHQHNAHANGNERMLTTSTGGPQPVTMTMTAAAAAATTITTTTTSTTTQTVAMTTSGIAATTATTISPAAATAPASPTSLNGSCNNNRNNSGPNKTGNSNNCHVNGASRMGSSSMAVRLANGNQQSNVCGPGPPEPVTPLRTLTPPQSLVPAALLANAAHTLTSVSGRIALGECSLNASGIDIAAHTAATATDTEHHHHHHQHHLQMHHGGGYAEQLPEPEMPAIGDDDMDIAIAGVRVGVIGLTSGMPGVSQTTMATARPKAHCALCCQPICDRYIMRVVDTSFHEGCLKCATCSLHLVQSCFTRDGKLYCRIDYERQFMRNRCLGCGHKINSEELVMRTLENVFHLKCFACVVCGSMLKKGEQYVVKQGQLFCRFDYEKEVEMLQGYDFYGDDLFPPKLDGRRGPKRPRTILNTQQRRAFKASFEVSPKPCRKVRENLAKETGLSLRIVQVWFQNQRAKVKKIQKKAKQEHPKGTSDSQDSQESDSSCLAKIKDEAHSDTESLLESPYTGATNTAAATEMSAGVAMGGKLSRCTIKDEHESTPFNCMETNKENCNKTNEPILNTILGLSYATFQQLMGPFSQSPMVNPIDRLYSMQNSYFRPDDPMGYNESCKDSMIDN